MTEHDALTAVSRAECRAIRNLYLDGRNVREIAFMLERDERTVNPPLRGHCVEHLGRVRLERQQAIGPLPGFELNPAD